MMHTKKRMLIDVIAIIKEVSMPTTLLPSVDRQGKNQQSPISFQEQQCFQKKLQCPVRESISFLAMRNKQNYHSISFFLFLLVDKRSTRNENYKSQDIWKCLLKENCGVDKRRHVITESQKIYNYLLGLDYHNKTLHLHSIV